MAQLIKIMDYVSRYENDLTRYPTQFIRLKRYQWKRVKSQWEHGFDFGIEEEAAPEIEEEQEQPSWFSRLFRKRAQREEPEQVTLEELSAPSEEIGADLEFQASFASRPTSVDQLRKRYVDQLFQFQLKWASSTLMEHSKVDPKLFSDALLRELTQQLPDSYLLFYYPIVKVNKAPVELDILLLTPVACYCITVLDDEQMAAYIGSGERFWTKKVGERDAKVLNPTIALNRMEKIVSNFFAIENVDFPVRKVVLSRTGYIDYPGMPFDLQSIDRKTYRKWLQQLSKNPSPMKHTQFKAAQAILNYAQTTAASRLFQPEEEHDK